MPKVPELGEGGWDGAVEVVPADVQVGQVWWKNVADVSRELSAEVVPM
jgi:hypothetical protein